MNSIVEFGNANLFFFRILLTSLYLLYIMIIYSLR